MEQFHLTEETQHFSWLDPPPCKKDFVRHRPSPLKFDKSSRKIRKPSVPLPEFQYRRPVIIHTYSPKVIQTDPANFMWLVQSLTGSSDTRSRCRKSKRTAAALSQQATNDCKIESSNSSCVSTSVQGDQKFERVQASKDTSTASCSVRDNREQKAEVHNQSDDLFLQDGFSKINERKSVDSSPRGPLSGFIDRVFSYSAPSPSAFQSSVPSSESASSASTDPCTIAHNPTCDPQLVFSQPQPLFPSLNLSKSFPSESILNDSSLIPSSTAWNLDGLLISPFKGCSFQNLFSPGILLNSPMWDARTLECLASPTSNDAFLYREFEDGRAATDTFLLQPIIL